MATLNAHQSIRGALDNNTTTVSLSRLKQGASSTTNSQVNSRRTFVLKGPSWDMVLQWPPKKIAIKVDTIQEY